MLATFNIAVLIVIIKIDIMVEICVKGKYPRLEKTYAFIPLYLITT